MKSKIGVRETVAKYLLQIKAVKLSPKKPFTWASGWKSPIYCDNRVTLSHPAVRTYMRQQFVNIIQEEFGEIDAVVGVATGGIAQGALIAQELGVPFAYVRASSKGHGLENKIEGHLEKGQNVIVIEDLISTGGSSLKAVDAIRKAGGNVKALLAIFTYGFPVAEKAFSDAKCKYFTLSDYESLIPIAVAEKYITEKERDLLKEWRLAPDKWGI